MSNGLFFTGTVLKNNRNLLEEENARERLAMDKEKLAMQKEDIAARRKEARRKGSKAEIKNYDVGDMDPFLVDQFQPQVGEYQGFAIENAMAIYDGDNDAKNQQLGLQRDLNSTLSKYNNIIYTLDVIESRLGTTEELIKEIEKDINKELLFPQHHTMEWDYYDLDPMETKKIK